MFPYTFYICYVYCSSASLDNNELFILFRLSPYLYTAIGTLLTVLFGFIISNFIRDDSSTVRPELLSPIVHFLLPEDKKQKKDLAEYCTVETALRMTSYDDEKEKEANL